MRTTPVTARSPTGCSTSPTPRGSRRSPRPGPSGRPTPIAGCLWRLYLLRSWVYADPVGVAREFEAGRPTAAVDGVVAGVADPPGPDELREMVDQVLRGIAASDFADVLLRAAAFARVVATGRVELPDGDTLAAARIQAVADQLDRAADWSSPASSRRASTVRYRCPELTPLQRRGARGSCTSTAPPRNLVWTGPTDRRGCAQRNSGRHLSLQCRSVPGRGSPGSQNQPLRAATRREALPVRRTSRLARMPARVSAVQRRVRGRADGRSPLLAAAALLGTGACWRRCDSSSSSASATPSSSPDEHVAASPSSSPPQLPRADPDVRGGRLRRTRSSSTARWPTLYAPARRARSR